MKGYKCKNIYTKKFKPNKGNVSILFIILSFFLISKYNQRILFFSLLIFSSLFPHLSYNQTKRKCYCNINSSTKNNYSHKAPKKKKKRKRGRVGSHWCVTQTERGESFPLKPISDEECILESFMRCKPVFRVIVVVIPQTKKKKIYIYIYIYILSHGDEPYQHFVLGSLYIRLLRPFSPCKLSLEPSEEYYYPSRI